MKLVEKKTFAEYFDEMIARNDGRGLIGRMQSLEVSANTLPPVRFRPRTVKQSGLSE